MRSDAFRVMIAIVSAAECSRSTQCSTPEYSPSVASRTTTRSVSGNRVPSPAIARAGRTDAKRSSSWRSATLTERNPLPIGVVIGPLSATRFFRTDSRTSSGSGVPRARIAFSPASTTSQSIETPVASVTTRAAFVTSGPIPSPGIMVTR